MRVSRSNTRHDTEIENLPPRRIDPPHIVPLPSAPPLSVEDYSILLHPPKVLERNLTREAIDRMEGSYDKYQQTRS